MAVHTIKRRVRHRLIRARQSVKNPGKIRKKYLYPFRKKTIDPSTLHFGQQHISTYQLFEYPWHTVPLESFPHYRFLDGNRDAYREYLRRSWDYHDVENTQEARKEKVSEFENLRSDIVSNGVRNPVEYVTRPDGKRVLYHGNHRASIAGYLNIPLPAVEIPMEAFLIRKIRIANDYYGVGNEGIPYASVYHNGEPIIQGRRRDLIDRHNRLKTEDIRDQKVIDLGCNIGSTSFLAADEARAVFGVDHDPQLVSAAISLNSIFAKPCTFEQMDLSEKHPFEQSFDTGFCFSIDDHVNDDEMLVTNIDNLGIDVLYFETHIDDSIPDSVTKMGTNIEPLGTTGTHGTRELYRIVLP